VCSFSPGALWKVFSACFPNLCKGICNAYLNISSIHFSFCSRAFFSLYWHCDLRVSCSLPWAAAPEWRPPSLSLFCLQCIYVWYFAPQTFRKKISWLGPISQLISDVLHDYFSVADLPLYPYLSSDNLINKVWRYFCITGGKTWVLSDLICSIYSKILWYPKFHIVIQLLFFHKTVFLKSVILSGQIYLCELVFIYLICCKDKLSTWARTM